MSLVLDRHLLYKLALCGRLHDMSGMNMVSWLGTCLARPDLHYAIDWQMFDLLKFLILRYTYTTKMSCNSVQNSA